MGRDAIRSWYLVHKWSSVVCTAFLLLLCLTGLPLIFHDEIDGFTRAPQIAETAARRPVNLDDLVRRALAERPGTQMVYLTFDEDRPLINAMVAPSMEAADATKTIPFDVRTGERIDAPPADEGVMVTLLDLHSTLLLGQPGQYFLSGIGVLFLVALVSGLVVYAPFMRKLAFGTVRKDRNARVKWLDTHNMAGIVTLGWMSVVALTGLVLTMAVPIRTIWQMQALGALAAPYKNVGPGRGLAAIDEIARTVRAAAPDGRISFIAWPGSPISTQHHFMVAVTGNTPLTRQLIRPAMVDAESGRLIEVGEMPWYVKALFLSVPLHFGDYGGLALKILWALLDVAAIVVLGTGLYLWIGRSRMPEAKRAPRPTSRSLVIGPAE